MPITCHHPLRDMIFQVLYVCQPEGVRELIEESVIHIASAYNSDGVKSALQEMRPQEQDSMCHLQVRFFTLLNQDEEMRRKVAQPHGCFVSALCPHKAERFYDTLCDDLIPNWIKDEEKTLESFIDEIRMAYLCS